MYEKYAGFWKRAAAHIIDQILLGVVHMVVIFPIWISFFISYFDLDELNGSSDYVMVGNEVFDGFPLYMIFVFAIAVGILVTIMDWLYYALMESSSKQATIGKMVLGIKVTDVEGNRIGFGRASGRFFAKILSAMILCFGYIMAAFTDKKQALHDILANCLVVNSLYDYQVLENKENQTEGFYNENFDS